MADPAQYGETVDPKNPPNSVLQPEVRKATFWAYIGPLIIIVVVLGIALLYWSTRDANARQHDRAHRRHVRRESGPGRIQSRPDAGQHEG